jgi:hypothetical protein
MFVLAHHYNVRIPPDSPKMISEWDAKPQSVMKLPGAFLCGDATQAIAHAIAWDSSVTSLVMDAVALPTLHVFLQTLFSKSPFLTRISLDDYLTSPPIEFDFSNTPHSKLNELSFRNCHTVLLFQILKGLQKFEGRIGMLTISKCRLLKDHYALLYRMIGTLPAFLSLTSLRLEDGSADGLDLPAFASFLSVPRLKYLSVGRSEFDVSALLSAIAPVLASVRSLLMTSARLSADVPDLVFAPSLVYFDLSRTAVHPTSLRSLVAALVTRPRRSLLTLVLADLITSSTSGELAAAFELPQAQPVLAEFNYSGNELAPGDLPRLLSFLATQRHLQFVALSRCFRENQRQSLEMLAEFVVESRLPGLEINGDDARPLGQALTAFVGKLIGRAALSTLLCERSACGDAGLAALAEFVKGNGKLSGLACDGARPETKAMFVRAYEVFAGVERLATPKGDLALFPGCAVGGGGGAVGKHPPKASSLARSAEWEGLDGNASSTVQPMNALIGIMSLMVSALKNPEVDGNIFGQRDMVGVFRESMITTNIALRAGERTQDPLLDMMDPQSQTAEEFMTEYQTMHVF